MYRTSLAFSPAGIDACAYWRMFMPHLNIPHSRFLFTEGMPAINEMSECDAIVVQRLMFEGNIKFLDIARATGLRIIYDLDDNVWHLPNANPAKHLFENEKTVSGLDECAKYADIVTASTKELKKVIELKWGSLRNIASGKPIPVVHIDNCVDTRFFRKSLLSKDEDKVVIGWGGSNTHEGDVKELWSYLPKLLAKYSNVYLEFVGQEPPLEIRRHARVRQRPWCHISEYQNRFATWNWDIVLAPLEEHRFNQSKSCIKMIEAGCINAVCLAQAINPYEYFCSFNKDLKWLLCRYDMDWERKLDKLVTDKIFRQDMGNLMHRNVIENFNITRTVPVWQEVSQSIF